MGVEGNQSNQKELYVFGDTKSVDLSRWSYEVTPITTTAEERREMTKQVFAKYEFGPDLEPKGEA